MAEIKMPSFTKGKNNWEKRMLTGDVNYSCGESNRFIKTKYTILQPILPVHFCDNGDNLSVIDKECCALVNLCPSVIPQD